MNNVETREEGKTNKPAQLLQETHVSEEYEQQQQYQEEQLQAEWQQEHNKQLQCTEVQKQQHMHLEQQQHLGELEQHQREEEIQQQLVQLEEIHEQQLNQIMDHELPETIPQDNCTYLVSEFTASNIDAKIATPIRDNNAEQLCERSVERNDVQQSRENGSSAPKILLEEIELPVDNPQVLQSSSIQTKQQIQEESNQTRKTNSMFISEGRKIPSLSQAEIRRFKQSNFLSNIEQSNYKVIGAPFDSSLSPNLEDFVQSFIVVRWQYSSLFFLQAVRMSKLLELVLLRNVP